MDYRKFTFTLNPDNQEFREILTATLGEFGFEGFVENENSVEAYIDEKICDPEIIDQLTFEPLFSYNYLNESIPDQNWNEVWEKNYFNPLVIAGRCVVRAPFHIDFPVLEYNIIIEPNMAFGTGNHETTTMMMEYILESNLVGMSVLDMGCGTGILSILSSKCGAEKVTSIDIDKWSFEGTAENAQINSTSNIIPILGDASAIPNEMFDLILANIHKNIIMADLPVYSNVLKPGGAIIVSGFYEPDLDDILEVSNNLGLSLVDSNTKNNWCRACFSLIAIPNEMGF